MRSHPSLFHAGSALLAAFTALVLTPEASLASERQVTNTATASWNDGGRDQTVGSNTVTFDVTQPEVELTTFVPFPSAPQSAELNASYCSSATAPSRLTIAGAPEGAHQTDILPTRTVRVGQNLVLRINAQSANFDPAARDELRLELTTPSGDVETLTAVEDSIDSGIFFASIGTLPLNPAPVTGDCRLSLRDGEEIGIAAFIRGNETPFLTGAMDALADPFGVVFDSLDGKPVDGATVTLIDVATGQPAEVFSFDGVTPYPNTVISGSSATDANGDEYAFAPGEYRFPLVAFGNYRLQVTPPAPYTGPSVATPAELAQLTAPSGGAFQISDASYGGTFAVDSVIPVQIDYPLDAPGGDVSIDKRASREIVQPGDAVFYTVTLRNTNPARASRGVTLTDRAAPGLRLQTDSIRIDGQPVAKGLTPDADGNGFSLALDSIDGGMTRRVTYAMTVRDDAPIGDAENLASITAPDGNSATAQAGIRIERDGLTARMTIIGRIVDGGCRPDGEVRGIPGVRVMMEDGSFAITDYDGRYHFEGVVPGNHVVQAIRYTLPEGGAFVDCTRSTRSAGSPISRFVSGQGGSLVRADFHAVLPASADIDQNAAREREERDNIAASGASTDFLALGDGPDGFIFPEVDHNPRSPSIRVVVRHRAGQRVALHADGELVSGLAFDGTKTSADKTFAVSIYRGIPLEGPTTQLRAEIQNADGRTLETYERPVYYSTTPLRAQIVPEQSRLIADGASAPVLAVRMTDRNGRPVHAGIAGSLTIDSPYQTRSAIEAAQSRELSGFGNASASWLVEGDDGIAYIELAPTLVSGALRANFTFTDGETTREERLEAWVEPGDQPWTLIGLAEGSIGARSVAENMEREGDFDSHLGDNARVAFYAKGRVLGKYLATIAYDSAKQENDQRLLGTIDPAAYYTVFGDNSQRFFDAASRDKIYVRVESSTFYALYGDFETGFDETDLARYQRIATGVKAEGRFGQVEAQGFAAKIGSRQRRDEIQGQGISGPYRLSARRIVPNSETVAIEVRDRLRSDVIVSSQTLTRFIDYDVDLLSGTITFAQPVLSRDPALNPQFIVVNYDVDALGQKEWNAGGRVTWSTDDDSVRVGFTGLTEKGDEQRTNLGAVDVRVRIGEQTEVRAEAAMSRQNGATSNAYLAEVEHVSGPFDLLAYVRHTDADYGVGQQNVADRGRRRVGVDGRARLTEEFSVVASAWHDESLIDTAKRDAVEVRAVWQTAKTDAFVGVAHVADTLADGRKTNSTILQAGGTQRLLDNTLEVTGATSVPLGGTGSIALPTRHTLGVRYTVSRDVKVIGSYEIARGDAIDANTVKVGAEITPWEGGRVVSSIGQDTIGRGPQEADANRTFAAFALGHSFRVGERLLIDATLDGNKTLSGGIALADTVNPAQPEPSGGQFDGNGLLGEDFTAFTLGAAWSAGDWNARARGEYRDGELADRTGADLAIIRRLGAGSVVGGGATWTRAENETGGTTQIVDAALSVAHRPASSAFSLLSKVEYRSDEVTGAVDGFVGAAGQTALLTSGDAKLRRLIGSVSTNWSPIDRDEEDGQSARTEVGVFAGLRHNFDRVEGFDLGTTTLLGGLDLRIGLTDRIEIGGKASVRHDLSSGTTAFSVGPEIGFVPTDNVLLSVGYNIVGFRDPDFQDARSTDKGLFASVRIKLDDDSFNFLGLGR